MQCMGLTRLTCTRVQTSWPDADGQGSSRTVLSFASNDYLGLSTHGCVQRAIADAASQLGTGAGQSLLPPSCLLLQRIAGVVGSSHAHGLEQCTSCQASKHA